MSTEFTNQTEDAHPALSAGKTNYEYEAQWEDLSKEGIWELVMGK